MIPKEIEDQFFEGMRSETVRFAINDTVRITEGARLGAEAAVICISTLSPEVAYVVEPFTPPFGDLVVPQDALALVMEAD